MVCFRKALVFLLPGTKQLLPLSKEIYLCLQIVGRPWWAGFPSARVHQVNENTIIIFIQYLLDASDIPLTKYTGTHTCILECVCMGEGT